MTRSSDLRRNPVHLGLGATAAVEPNFTGAPEWYAEYVARHDADGVEGRLVAMHSFDGAWDSWEMHPHGTEVVICTEGTVELVQEIDGHEAVTQVVAGEYAINPPGVWHTANDTGSCSAIFITAGHGTEHRPR